MALLRSLAQLSVPTIDAVANAVSVLRAAIYAQAELAGTSAEQNAGLASLLKQALQHCRVPDSACPVCGGALSANWADTAQARLKQADELATKASAVASQRDQGVERLRALIRTVPPELEGAEQVGLSTQLLAAWRIWCAAPTEPAALCNHAEAAVLDLHTAHAPFVGQARNKLDGLQSAWRPVERELAAWLAAAKAVQAEAATLKALESAESWLKEAEEELRDARFAPLAADSQKIWAALRQQSSVNLANIKLDGTGTRRRVELNVSVDGRDGVALSVMSQGELNALALSLFLPRMMSAESPFRFLVIDDPVQAMDSHKVDGLAHMLEDVAKRRQVIVLTHDTRLLEAMRRLKIDATVLGVQRRADSVIEVHVQLDAVERHLADARTIAFNEQQFGPKIVARMVPGFCRLAVEAACVEAIRRRRLARGDLHDDVERTIENVRGLHELAALALFDDTARGGQVYAYINKKLQRRAGDAFRNLKEGAHGSFTGSSRDLISDSSMIADMLRTHS